MLAFLKYKSKRVAQMSQIGDINFTIFEPFPHNTTKTKRCKWMLTGHNFVTFEQVCTFLRFMGRVIPLCKLPLFVKLKLSSAF